MPSIRSYPATTLAVVLSVLAVVYVILTPTNVLLSLIPVLLFLGLGVLVDSVSISPGSLREYPGTLVALPVVIAVGVFTILTPTNVLIGWFVAVLLLAVAALYDRAPISLRAPRQSRATIVALLVSILLGAYSILTPTNLLLWAVAASTLFGIGVLVDWLLAEALD